MVAVGAKVQIVVPPGAPLLACVWWPPGTVTGTVQKIFKNGKVAVAIDQLGNRSDDGKRTLHFQPSWLIDGGY